MASAIRIGIVGAGDNTRVRHIPGLQAQEGVEIVSVCNRSREPPVNGWPRRSASPSFTTIGGNWSPRTGSTPW